MWKHRYETITDLSPEDLWPIVATIPEWPESDHNLETVEMDDAPAVGARFVLKPRGGPRLRFEIERFEPPKVYADVCRLPFAWMRTIHDFEPIPSGTRMGVTLEIEGPLSFLWRRTVGRKHAAGLPAQSERLVNRARRCAPAARAVGV